MGLKEFRVTVNIPYELEPLVATRVQEEHYRSKSAYLLSLVFFDLISRSRHKLTSNMVAEQPEILDKIVAEIVRDFDKTPRQPSDWLRRRLAELIQEEAEHRTGAEPD